MQTVSGRGVALVTGAASGIGRACALRLAAEGYHIAAVDRHAGGLDSVAAELPGRAGVFAADLASSAQRREVFASITDSCGAPSALINAAGVYVAEPCEKVTMEAWQRSLDINLLAAAELTNLAVPAMRRAGTGSIVNISSRNALMSSPRSGPYDAAKAGLLALTRSLAMELGGDGIRVNAVCPGVTRTGMTAEFMSDPGAVDSYLRLIPLGRFGQPHDIAGVVSFLCSGDAAFLTGQAITVDGGQGCGQDFGRIFG